MRLTHFTYGQYEDEDREWLVDGLTLGPINLVVGKNASGKSRTLAVINTLARLLANETKISLGSSHFNATFDHNGTTLNYHLRTHDGKVTLEEFHVDEVLKLSRGEKGAGRIYAVKLDDMMEFQTPEEDVAAVARRDLLQHPFFEPLHEWGNSLRFYPFGTPLGRENIAILVNNPNIKINDKDFNQVIPIFRKGETEFKERFISSIVEDMKSLDYDIVEIGVMSPRSISVIGPQLPGQIVSLYVRERGLDAETEQLEMSQGMFRAASLIIQLNYSRLAGRASTIVIDDIGEGLDFERSCSLIKLLMRKSADNVQLLMATNDRFVMNSVPLSAWSLLHREGNHCRVLNFANSRHAFEEFEFTGLSNFDFFATDFIHDKSIIGANAE